jgi:hypothetical protein
MKVAAHTSTGDAKLFPGPYFGDSPAGAKTPDFG